jgi:hypothetical protein
MAKSKRIFKASRLHYFTAVICNWSSIMLLLFFERAGLYAYIECCGITVLLSWRIWLQIVCSTYLSNMLTVLMTSSYAISSEYWMSISCSMPSWFSRALAVTVLSGFVCDLGILSRIGSAKLCWAETVERDMRIKLFYWSCQPPSPKKIDQTRRTNYQIEMSRVCMS